MQGAILELVEKLNPGELTKEDIEALDTLLESMTSKDNFPSREELNLYFCRIIGKQVSNFKTKDIKEFNRLYKKILNLSLDIYKETDQIVMLPAALNFITEYFLYDAVSMKEESELSVTPIDKDK